MWGPYRRAVLGLPPSYELRFNRALGAFMAGTQRGAFARILRNLERAFPERSDLSEIAVQAFETHFANQYLPFSFGRMRLENAASYLRIEGMERLDRALAQGRGVVLAHPHMGPAQLPLCVLGLMGYPMHQVGGGEVTGLSESGRRYAEFRHHLERDLPARIHDGKGFIRPVLRALAGGGVVMTTCDGTGGGEELGRRLVRNVLGQPMKLPVGALYLALRSGAPILMLHTFRSLSAGPVCVTRISGELRFPRDSSLAQGIDAGLDQVARSLDRVLRYHPGDWHFWDQYEPGCFLLDHGVADRP